MAISPKKALFALIPALILAACSTPTAAPSQTPDVACDPATATITWSPATDVGRVPAGVQLVTYTAGGANRSPRVPCRYSAMPSRTSSPTRSVRRSGPTGNL